MSAGDFFNGALDGYMSAISNGNYYADVSYINTIPYTVCYCCP